MMSPILRRFVLATALVIGAASAAGAQQPAPKLFGGLSSNSEGPVNVEADALDVVEQDGQRISTFSGNVTVTRGDTVLKAGKIVIYSTGDAKPAADAATGDAKPAEANAAAAPAVPGGGDFSRIVASGKVYINSKDQTATGDEGSVDLKTRLITLTGNVTLSQGKNVITGQQLVYDMNTGRARIEQAAGNRIRGVFTPGSGSGR